MSITSGENREAAALAEQLTSTAQPAQQAEAQVPVHVVQAMREELKALKEKNDAFASHIQMMQWQQQQQPSQKQQEYSPFQGKDPKDSILVEDAQRVFSEFSAQVKNDIRSQIGELKVAAKTNDYKEMINKYLPKAAQEDPEILQEIKNSANPYQTAYLYAKSSKAYQDDLIAQRTEQKAKEPASKPSNDMDRIVNNARQSGSLASVGNQANNADKYPSFSRMSDEEFRQYKAKIKYKPAVIR